MSEQDEWRPDPEFTCSVEECEACKQCLACYRGRFCDESTNGNHRLNGVEVPRDPRGALRT